MIRIMIYNKDCENAQLLCKVISAYFRKVRHSYRVSAYTKVEDVVNHVRSSAAKDDVAFFDCRDIQNAARLIKQFRDYNNSASWVHIGPDLEDLCKILLMRPSAYLADLSDVRRVLSVMQQLDTYHQEIQKKTYFTFKCDGDIVSVSYSQISYFESSAKKVTLHMSNCNRTYHFTAKLDDIEQMVPGIFLRCHQSYLVNLQMIRNLDSKNHVFILHSMDEIYISRRSYVTSKEAYETYLQSARDYNGGIPN